MVLIGSGIWCRFGEIFLVVGYTSFAICFVLVLFARPFLLSLNEVMHGRTQRFSLNAKSTHRAHDDAHATAQLLSLLLREAQVSPRCSRHTHCVVTFILSAL